MYNEEKMTPLRVFQEALVIKNPPANAGDARDAGSIVCVPETSEGGHPHILGLAQTSEISHANSFALL